MNRSAVLLALLTLAPAGSPAVADTLVFRQGLNGYTGTRDTFLSQAAATSSHGAQSVFEWDSDDPGGSDDDNVGLLKFRNLFGPGVDQIPIGAQITSATLRYNVGNSGDTGHLHDVLVTWGEGVTWDEFGGSPGPQPNEYGPLVAAISGGSSTHDVDVTASLAAWSLDPDSNNGWIILPTGSDGVEVASSENGGATSRPRLTVVFNEGPPVPNLVRGPYLQTLTETSVTIAWRTSIATDSVVNFGTTLGALNSTVSDAASTTEHAVEVTGLTPGGTYYYEVGHAGGILAGNTSDHTFRAAPPTGTPQRFVTWIVGDSGNGSPEQAAVRDAMLSFTSGDPPDLFLHVGDMAYNNGTDIEFTENFFAPYAGILQRTVCWPSIGNHEADNSDSPTQSGPYYAAYILPTLAEAGGLASGTEAYYSFDYANAHFVCLDSHDTPRGTSDAMLTWLQDDLLATDQEWLIAFWHHPPYTKGSHDSDDFADSGGRMIDMRVNALPILEAAGVDLVLAGHSHIYERSFLVDGAYDTPTTAAGHILDAGDGAPSGNGPYQKPAGLAANQGAVYVVAGHGGRGLGQSGVHPLMATVDLAHGSCLLEIDGRTLTLRNLRSTGAISDVFRIIKSPPGDLDGDGDVDLSDLAILLADFGCPAACPGDADGDGDSDLSDLAIVLGNFGR